MKKLLTLCLMILIGHQAFSAYLRNVPQELQQPDGTVFQALATGDEYYHWLHDHNGFTIVRDPETGFFVYAVLDQDELVPTPWIPGIHNPEDNNLTPWLKIPAEKMYALRQTRFPIPQLKGAMSATNTGEMQNLVVFIRFADQEEFTRPLSSYNQDFNGIQTVSQKQYYLDVSDNQLTIETHFFPSGGGAVLSYQDGQSRSYYQPYDATTNPGGYDGDTERRVREHTLLKDALESVKTAVESAGLNIDMNNDGYVDNIVFVVRGGTDGWSDLLWPHMWALYSYDVTIAGKEVWYYNFQLDDVMDVSVLCHEMFHSLGAPDLYRYENNDITPVGPWDIMAYNQDPPQHMSAYMKMQYGGWFNEIPAITAAGTYQLEPLSDDPFAAYRISSPNSNEYFVVEYRRAEGRFESSVPGSGLIIYRINPAHEGNADGPPDEVYVYRPNGTPDNNGNLYSAHFSSSTGRTAISDVTNPSSFLSDGSVGGLNISNIGAAGETISFTVSFESQTFNPPQNLHATSGADFVDLEWEAPEAGDPVLSGFKVYRFGSLIHTISSPTTLQYRDAALSPGNYAYHVTALYENPAGESDPGNTVSVQVLEQKPDLLISEASANQSNLDAGSDLQLNLAVSNEGGLASPVTSLEVYISGQAAIDGNSILLDETVVSGLNPGVIQTYDPLVTIPDDLPTGNYHILVRVDGDHLVDESNENNNIESLPLGVRAAWPDLYITSAQVDMEMVYPGTQVELNMEWTNSGNKTAEACQLLIAVSDDEDMDQQELQIAYFSSPALDPGESYALSGRLRISEDVPPGSHFLLFMIDAGESVPESNESNNDWIQRLEVLPAEDLEVSNLQFETRRLKDAEDLELTYSLKNKGTTVREQITLITQISAGPAVSQTDPELDRVTVSLLEPGTEQHFTRSIRIPRGMAAGDYYIHLGIDPNSNVDDRIRDNDQIYRMLELYNVTDLSVQFSLESLEFEPGQAVSGSLELHNTETLTSGSSVLMMLWSTDDQADSGDEVVFTATDYGLAGHTSAVYPFTVDLSEDQLPGDYFLVAMADGEQAVPESDEQNNFQAVRIRILDLSSTEGSPNISSWKAYPNPAQDILHLAFSKRGYETQMILRDMTGRVWVDQSVFGTDYARETLGLSHLPKGVYVIQLLDSEGIRSKRILLQ